MIEVGRDSGIGCRWRDGVSGRGGLQGFLVGLPFVGVIHYGFFLAESCGLEELESDWPRSLSSFHGERPPMMAGRNSADPRCGFFFSNTNFREPASSEEPTA